MPIDGVCYGPYRMPGSSPPAPVPEAQIDADMAMIAKAGFKIVRTYDVNGGNRFNIGKAGKHGLTVGAGIDVTNNSAADRASIDEAWTQAENALSMYATNVVVHLCVGNEVDRVDNRHYDPNYILSLMTYAKQARSKYPAIDAKVTTCFSGTVLMNANSPWLNVVKACDDVVYLTLYPYYGQKAAGYPQPIPGNIEPQMNWSWQNGLQQVKALGKTLVIAESGWPSAGGWGASAPNEETFSKSLAGYVAGQWPNWNVSTFWFEMFDEPWKTNEGGIGPYFGLYTSGANPQPKFKFPP